MADAAATGSKTAAAEAGGKVDQLGAISPWAAFEQPGSYATGSLLAVGEDHCGHRHAVAGGDLHPGLAGVDRLGGRLLPRVAVGSKKSPVVGEKSGVKNIPPVFRGVFIADINCKFAGENYLHVQDKLWFVGGAFASVLNLFAWRRH